MSEDKLQSECFKWFWNTFPSHRRCLFHVPNGGLRNKREATKFKAMGVIAGIPDLVLVHAGQLVGFELKTATGRVSEVQKQVHQAWKAQDVAVYIIRDLETFQQIINNTIHE